MSAPVDVVRAWTRADLETLPDDGLRYELVDGNLVVTPPTQRHTWWANGVATSCVPPRRPAGG